MIFRSDTSGIDKLLARVRKAQTELPRVTVNAAQRAGDTVKGQLASAAPKGQSGGMPPPGDSPGPLSGSFSAKAEQRGIGAHMELKTSQPFKLKLVTGGRKAVVPVTKKALMWKGLPHPVMRSGPVKANDFVTPVMNRRANAVKAEMQKAIQEIRSILGG